MIMVMFYRRTYAKHKVTHYFSILITFKHMIMSEKGKGIIQYYIK